VSSFEGGFLPVTTPFAGDDVAPAPLGTPEGDAIEDIKEVLATAGLL
jgi:hypothetical protein